jgi:oligosaccharide repeat unit polymerase
MPNVATYNQRSRSGTLLFLLLLLGTVVVAGNTAGWWMAVQSAAVLLVSYTVIRRVCDPLNPRKLSLLGFWYVGFLVTNFLPAFFVYADQEGPYRGTFIDAVLLTLITVPLGALLSDFVWKFRATESDAFFDAPFEWPQIPRKLTRAYLFIAAVVLAISVAYVVEVPSIPLVHLIRSGDYSELILLREESFKLLDSHLLLAYYLLKALLYPYLIMVSLGAYLVTREKKWLRIFIASFVAGLLYNSLTLAKAPVANMILVLALFYYYYRGRALSLKGLLIAVVLFLAFPVVILVALGGTAGSFSVVDALIGISERIFYIPAELLYYYFEVFPAHVHYLHGGTSPRVAEILGQQFFDVENFVGIYAYRDVLESVAAPSAFIGYLNADFGMPGVILGGLFAGATMETFHVYIARRRKTILTVACYSFLTFAFLFLNLTALPTVLGGNGAILAVLLTAALARYAGLQERTIHEAAAN